MERQLHQPRLADLIAAKLREDILEGRLSEGDSLPRQEDLLATFNVSPPSVREALRILETEGLITVRRGNVGGAVVHLPTDSRISYMLSLVFQSRRTPLKDVVSALNHLEPLCAAICAERTDRHDSVVAELAAIIEEQRSTTEDLLAFNNASRRFHEQLVARCGNESLILLVGALERIWSGHVADWTDQVRTEGSEPSLRVLQAGIRDHERLLHAIDTGDSQAAQSIARKHLDATQAGAFDEVASRTVSSSFLE
jgi:DNA-binding FadR family transcriptional regulator